MVKVDNNVLLPVSDDDEEAAFLLLEAQILVSALQLEL
jgi:hypothetical protein